MTRTPSPSTTEVLVRLAFLIHGRFEASAAQERLSVQQVRMFGILRDREPTINELAGYIGLDKSSTSGLVVRAERRGFVSRVPDPHDGRSVRVRLEPAGRALDEVVVRRFGVDIQRILARLDDEERAQWTALTGRLLVTGESE